MKANTLLVSAAAFVAAIHSTNAQPAVTEAWVHRFSNVQIAPASGLLEYLDTLPPPGCGFYRIVQP